MIFQMNSNILIGPAVIKNAVAPLNGKVTNMKGGVLLFNELVVEKGDSIYHAG